MRIKFTKMQGAGNDFVMLDETRGRLGLSTAHYRWLADRHFGVGADQILTVRPSPGPGIDFEYVIHNADGAEVEQCGNGARCFLRFVRDQGLTTQDSVKVQTLGGVIEPRLQPDGRVQVNMGAPVFAPERIPFDASGLQSQSLGSWSKWPLERMDTAQAATIFIAPLSMGNPHAVQCVDDVARADLARMGPWLEHHPRFSQRVNAGFMQVLSRTSIALRVHERGVGETLACGTGACAAVVAGIRWGLLDTQVDVHTPGGLLTVTWSGALDAPVLLTGPATRVFDAEVELPAGL